MQQLERLYLLQCQLLKLLFFGHHFFSHFNVSLGVSAHEGKWNFDDFVINQGSKNKKEETEELANDEFLFA